MTTCRILPAVAVAIVLAATKSFANKPKARQADYFPLRTDYSWTYRNTEEGGYTVTVLREEPYSGEAVRYVVQLLTGVKIVHIYSKTPGWVLLHGESYPENQGLEVAYEPPKQYLPNPITVGRKWNWAAKDFTQTEHQESSRAVGFESITVPAGKFRAMKVVTEVSGGSTKTRTDWYADGVGLVKSTATAGQIKYGSELTDYSFKRK
jgi:hypothetical protein